MGKSRTSWQCTGTKAPCWILSLSGVVCRLSHPRHQPTIIISSYISSQLSITVCFRNASSEVVASESDKNIMPSINIVFMLPSLPSLAYSLALVGRRRDRISFTARRSQRATNGLQMRLLIFLLDLRFSFVSSVHLPPPRCHRLSSGFSPESRVIVNIYSFHKLLAKLRQRCRSTRYITASETPSRINFEQKLRVSSK
jgi:hypothetical protein